MKAKAHLSTSTNVATNFVDYNYRDFGTPRAGDCLAWLHFDTPFGGAALDLTEPEWMSMNNG
jgi:hypothetical protein